MDWKYMHALGKRVVVNIIEILHKISLCLENIYWVYRYYLDKRVSWLKIRYNVASECIAAFGHPPVAWYSLLPFYHLIIKFIITVIILILNNQYFSFSFSFVLSFIAPPNQSLTLICIHINFFLFLSFC